MKSKILDKKRMVNTHFYIPTSLKKKIDVEGISENILKKIQDQKLNDVLGYMIDDEFLIDLKIRLGKNKSKYKILSEQKEKEISKTISEFAEKFQKVLAIKYLPVRIFIFPWFPSEQLSKEMSGVMAYAQYYNTLHFYIDVKKYSKKSLLETLAHEFNHICRFQQYENLHLTILDNLILEGLAETFREDFIGGKVATWSKAFSQKQVLKFFGEIKPLFNLRDRKLYEEIFYGSKKFKRWTGYSVGYFLVKNFIKKNKDLSWKKIMSTDSREFVK